MLLSQRRDRATKSPSLDRGIVIQAAAVGVLFFFLNVGPSGLQGLSVVIGTLALVSVAAFVGIEWAQGVMLTVVAAYVLILFTPLTNMLARTLAINCSDTSGDAIVVLEGDPGYGRILHGLKLFTQSRAPLLVLTGVEGHPGGRRHYEIATLFGVHQNRILHLIPSGSGTRGEVEALRAAPQARDIRRIVLVTSRIHSLRATLVFRKLGFEICSAPTPDGNEQSDFWDPWGRVLMARDLVHECLGLIYYKTLGWI